MAKRRGCKAYYKSIPQQCLQSIQRVLKNVRSFGRIVKVRKGPTRTVAPVNKCIRSPDVADSDVLDYSRCRQRDRRGGGKMNKLPWLLQQTSRKRRSELIGYATMLLVVR